MITGLFGGLGLFIYGMRQMSEGFQKTAGKKLRHFLEILTTKPLMGVLVGTGVTAIIQSSSATTVMVVGFVNAGLMTLTQSIGVIMGANIGTTVTAQLVAFKLGDYVFHAIALGAFSLFFFKRKKVQYIGQILLGFGILFLGLNIMSDTMLPLRDSFFFLEMMEKFSVYPILGMLVGTVVTVMIQSSSATFGILLGLVSIGVIEYQAGIPVLLGSNIGTTVTAILSSIGTNITAKRAAAAHFTFNFLGAFGVIFLYYIIPDFADKVYRIFISLSNFMGQGVSPERLLANTHTVFNLLNTLIWLPFVAFMVRLVEYIIPGEDVSIKRGLINLDKRMLETPGVAINQVKNEVLRMFEITYDMVKESNLALLNGDLNIAESVMQKEDIINEIEEELIKFLTSFPKGRLSESDLKIIDMYFVVIDDIESIADDANDIVELSVYKIDNKVVFSKDAVNSINRIFNFICMLLDRTFKLIKEEDREISNQIIKGEKRMDKLEVKYREDHMYRLKQGTCDPNAGIIYLEVLDDLEHISDQAADISYSIVENRN
jgi:phosphate:Na+ symporter